jgi:hypothetical protein
VLKDQRFLTHVYLHYGGVNPANKGAIAGKFKDETVYYKRAVEDLKTRSQWRKLMRDVPFKDPSNCRDDSGNDVKEDCDGIGLDPTRAGAGSDPTRAGAGSDPTRPGAGSDPTRAGAGSDPTRAGAGSDPTRPGAALDPTRAKINISMNKRASNLDGSSSSSNRNDSDQGNDEISILNSKERVKKELITPFKVLVRKRGDEERRLDLYGHWQTVVYEIPPVREGVIPVLYCHVLMLYGCYLHAIIAIETNRKSGILLEQGGNKHLGTYYFSIYFSIIIQVNQHGNVEVWDGNECLIPRGARLLKSRHAMKV